MTADRAAPFVAINCAAIPESLIESELFGYHGGAFTGGRREANGGSLLLDEIGDMPLALQARQLRLLQDRQVVPLGGGQPVAVDFALICASNQALEQAVEQGRLRADLYYRINGLALELPPLRERTDLQTLCQRMLAGIAPGQPCQLAPGLLATFETYHWPGNLRQCANVLRTACAMLEPGQDTIE